MKATLPGGEPKSIADLLNEYEWKFAGLNQIAQTAINLDVHLVDHPGLRSFLGMDERTARFVDSLVDEYDEMKELIFQRLDDHDREKEPAEEVPDAN